MSEVGSGPADTPTANESAAVAAPIVDVLYDATCPECGYSLRGLPSDRCPECGLDITIMRGTRPQIPWEYRKERGALRAMWQTALMLTLRHKQFCAELNRPLDRKAARRFVWASSGLLFGTMYFVALGLSAFAYLTPGTPPMSYGAMAGWITVGWVAAFPVYMYLITLPARKIRRRRLPLSQRPSAAALMDYTSVVWQRLPLFCATALVIGMPLGYVFHDIAVGAILTLGLSAALLAIVSLLYVMTLLWTARRLLGSGGAVLKLLAVMGIEAASIIGAIVLVPLCVAYLVYIVASF